MSNAGKMIQKTKNISNSIKNNVKGNPEWRYLGPTSWNQKILRLAPFSLRFNQAAKVHDINYGIGGSFEYKRYSDERFAFDMAKVCRWNPFAWFFAFIYYLLVATAGVFFFNFHSLPDAKKPIGLK